MKKTITFLLLIGLLTGCSQSHKADIFLEKIMSELTNEKAIGNFSVINNDTNHREYFAIMNISEETFNDMENRKDITIIFKTGLRINPEKL